MARSFDIFTESTAKVDQIQAAFGREDYWLDRLGGDDSATLDSLIVRTDGTVAVNITQYLSRKLLPGAAAKVIPGDLKVFYQERWRPASDGQMRGQVTVSASGGVGSSRAENWLAPTAAGSKLRSTLSVEVKIPLVGGTLEKSIGATLAESIPSVLAFTTRWIDEHR